MREDSEGEKEIVGSGGPEQLQEGKWGNRGSGGWEARVAEGIGGLWRGWRGSGRDEGALGQLIWDSGGTGRLGLCGLRESRGSEGTGALGRGSEIRGISQIPGVLAMSICDTSALE